MLSKQGFIAIYYMKSIKKLILKIIAMMGIIFIPTKCFALEFILKPFFGLDIGWRDMQFVDLYGKGHFADRYYQTNPYVGLKLLDNLGIQLGYETTDKRNRIKLYEAGDDFLGVFPNGHSEKFSSNSKISGESFGVFINTDTFGQQYFVPTELSIFAGIAAIKAKMSHTEFTGNGYIQNPLPTITEKMNTAKKACPKIVIAANLTVPQIKSFSFKLSFGWEKTSNLIATARTKVAELNVGNQPNTMVIKLKDSYLTSIGFKYMI